MKLFVFITLLLCNIAVYTAPLKIGVLNFAPPFSSKSDTSNHYYGFVVDLMNTICQRLKISCEYVTIPKSGELDGLDKGLYDITFSPTPIDSLQSNKYVYSLPYLPSHGHFVTLNTDNTNSLNDINNKKIGVYKINDITSPIIMKLIEKNSFIDFIEPSELVNSLVSKKIDYILINQYSAKYIIQTISGQFKIVGDKISIGNGYGLIALKSHSSLINQINNTLQDMEKDGTYLKIFNSYFGHK